MEIPLSPPNANPMSQPLPPLLQHTARDGDAELLVPLPVVGATVERVAAGAAGALLLASVALNLALVWRVTASPRLQRLGYYMLASKCTCHLLAVALDVPPDALLWLLGDRAVSLLCILFEHLESFLCAAFLLHDANSALESLLLRCMLRRNRAPPLSSNALQPKRARRQSALSHPCRQLQLTVPWLLAGALCAALAVLTRDSGAALVSGRLCVGHDLVLHLLRLCGAAACLSLLCALALVARCSPTPHEEPDEPLSPETRAHDGIGSPERGADTRGRNYQMALAPVSEAEADESESAEATTESANEPVSDLDKTRTHGHIELADTRFGADAVESPATKVRLTEASGSLLPVLSLYVDALEIPAHEHVFTVQQHDMDIDAAREVRERVVNAEVTVFSPSSGRSREAQPELDTSKVVGETSPNGQTGSESSGTSGYSTDEPAECLRAAAARQATLMLSPAVSSVQNSLPKEGEETRVYSIHLQDSPIYSVLRRPPSPASPRALGPIHAMSRFLRSPARRHLSFEYEDSLQCSPWHHLSNLSDKQQPPHCSLELKHSRTDPTLGANPAAADDEFLVCVRRPTVTFNDVAVVYIPCSEPSSTHDSPAISAAALPAGRTAAASSEEESTSSTPTHETQTHSENRDYSEEESREHLWTMERLTIISVCIFVLTWLPSLLAGLLLAACVHDERSSMPASGERDTAAGVGMGLGVGVRRGLGPRPPVAGSLSGALGATLAADVARLAEHVCRFRPELAVVAEYFEWAAYASALLYPLSVLVIDRRLARDLSRAVCRVFLCRRDARRPQRAPHRQAERRDTARYPPAPVHTRKPPKSQAKI